MELPRRAEQRHHSYRRQRGALLPDVCLNLRLGKHRSAEVRSVATFRHEDDLPAPLLLNSEPQPGVLLQRRACDQVALVERNQEQIPGWRSQLRGLKWGSKTWRSVTMSIMRFRSLLVALILIGMMTAVDRAKAQSDREETSADITAPVYPSPPDINETRIFTELLIHNELRNAALLGYTEQRAYEL